MIFLKTVTAICLGVALCTAQTINISGTVEDTTGVGISGAMVKLEVADISTTTGSDGSFTLTNGSTHVQSDFIRSAVATNPMQIHNGKISFSLSGNTIVVIRIHGVCGRLLYNSNRTYGSGTHAIAVPLKATGIFIYKLNIGNETYSFKSSPFGTFATGRNAAPDNSSALAKQAKTSVLIADVISVVKEGQINYRDLIKTSDTTGIVVKMIPNAGNVTDADGNVYQSVRIGSQVWTVENLRTTKYSDGTAIPGPTFTSSQWSDLTTPAYCWYEDSTGAAYRRKWGALYNWYAVNTGKLAPEGWRVPSDADWTTLMNYLIANGYNWDGTTIENKVAKSLAAKTLWHVYDVSGTPGNNLSKNNASGFSALPGGYRGDLGNFYRQSSFGNWWSTTEDFASYAYYRFLGFSYEYLGFNITNLSYGFSVRLLRD